MHTNFQYFTRLALAQMIEEMKKQEHGIIKNSDPEFLHKYRVSLRKARSILSQLHGVLPDDKTDFLKSGLSEINILTSHARDLDVYLIRIKEYSEAMPDSDLNSFLFFIKKSVDVEYAKISELLKSKNYKKMRSDFLKILTQKHDDKTSELSLVTAVDRIKKLYSKIERKGAKLDDASQDGQFHELRICCKKTRYLLEFLEKMHESDKLSYVIKKVKSLQSILGDHQDLSVQQQKIIMIAEAMLQDGCLTDSLRDSIEILIVSLRSEQNLCRTKFFNDFGSFSNTYNQEIFKTVLEQFRSLDKYCYDTP